MKYWYTILFILYFSMLTYGEVINISGKVLNDENQALQYINIGIIDKTIGTVSDKNGYFLLKIDKAQLTSNDSLRFSMVGYHSKSFLITEINNKLLLTIILTKKIETIPEAIITGNKIKTKVKGTTHFPVPLYVMLSDSTMPNQNLGSAIARSFNINHKNTIIEDIRFYTYSNYDTVVIRINVYSVKRRKPYKSLLSNCIYTEIIGKNHDWIHVNLKQHNIVVNDDIIISIEWVGKSENGDYLFYPLARPSIASLYYKHGSQNTWERWPHMSSLMEITIKY